MPGKVCLAKCSEVVTVLIARTTGQATYLSAPSVRANPLAFNLSLEDVAVDDSLNYVPGRPSTESRLDQMLAAQAAHREDLPDDDEKTALDTALADHEKRERLQKSLQMSASNGDVARMQTLLNGPCKQYIDVNRPDEDGTAPLLYASCFGHAGVVKALLNAGANVEQQDVQQWTSLMWATTNHHKDVAQVLLDHGASPEAKSSSGRTAWDFVAPNSDMSDYLNDNGYKIGNAGMGEDFYQSGEYGDHLEEEMAENELKRRMMMESAMNLEVDLGNLGLDEKPETPEDQEDEQEFVWDRCLNDQMFVFQEAELGRILDIVITNMRPQRSPSQKPVPANVIFLAARYAHYHANHELLEILLTTATERMNDIVEKMQYDMTILAFWMSNSTLLLHYLKKDTGMMGATVEFQAHLAELINEIFVLIIRDAERRMDKVLDSSMLEHETIPGFEDVHFQNEWKFLRSRRKAGPAEPLEKRYRPPSPKQRAKPSPRMITSLMSSTLFVMDLYDIHSVITTQVLAQLIYWVGAELFNRIMSNRKYLARTKAMQVRMNVSVLEDFAVANNRQPEHYENGSMTMIGEATMDTARQYLAPVIQLLQWLQISTSVGDDLDALKTTISQLPRLSPQQLLHAVQYYRAEVGEKTLPRPATKYLNELLKQANEKRLNRQPGVKAPNTPAKRTNGEATATASATPAQPANEVDEDEVPEHLLLDPALMLPFQLPTSTDMIISYGAGFGGTNRERARKYVPTVPPEFLAKLEFGGRRVVSSTRFSTDSYS